MTKLIASLLALVVGMAAPVAHAQDKIQLGLLPFSESLAAVVADKQGYFKAEGIEVETSLFNSGALSLPLLQAGKLDIAFSNTVATLQALEQGLDGTIIAPGAVVRSTAPDTTTALMVLKGSAKTLKDLEGKRVAVNVINSTAWLYAVAALDKQGVDRSKVRFVEVPFPQMNDPLLNKQIDAITQVDPFKTVLEDGGKVEALAYTYVEVQPNADITQYVALASWTKKNPDLAKRFARAIRKGAEYVNAKANEADVRDVNIKFTNLNAALKDRVQLPLFGLATNPAEIARTADLMVKYGMSKKRVDLTGRFLGAE